ncbi:MAG: hypothetical protein JW881_14025 [Spirochaetales bacterium]|nr:hypothetical protein [Spirochaetales bacterium]
MVKERTYNTLKARISSHIRKMAYDGLRIILYDWRGNELTIHTACDDNVPVIADLMRRRFPDSPGKIDIFICGDSKVMRL